MEENLVYAKNNLTEGKIYPALIRFSLPVLGALFLQSLYGAVDPACNRAVLHRF